MDKIYNIRCGVPLILDHEYAHCANTVEFQGFGREQEISSIYLLLGKPVQLKVPLTEDFKVLVTAPITRKAGKVKAQLMECKLASMSEEYEYVRYSDIFEVVITPSLAEESEIEVTDPRLELIYTDMHEAYLSMLAYEHSAQTYAESASASATTATTKAGEASASATSAASSASTASDAATTATTKASEASGSATTANTKASEASGSATTAHAEALVAEGWAVGKQNGVDVPSSSDYYHNNAKWHADMAERNAVPFNVRNAILALFESAAYAETGLTDEITIVESWANEVTSLAVSPTTLSLTGATPQVITATVVPQTAPVTWSSSDTSIATVVGGVVTGASNGTCVITASAGTKSATCSVTVTGFATLESISAVYTQSGTVYDTDSLDSLKADLVVTATYSDSTTETITNYTLSGTLTVGTSTITVTYQGKFTTFNVTVSVRTVSVENGAIASADGAESASTTRARTDYIPITNRVFAIDANINTSEVVSYGARYYDAQHTYIGHSDSANMTPQPDRYGDGEYLIDGWPVGDGTEYTDATSLSGTVAYVRFVMRNTAGTNITNVSGTVTVDGIDYTIAYA